MAKNIRKFYRTTTTKSMDKLAQQTNQSKMHFTSVETFYFSTKKLKYILNLVAYTSHYENL